MFNVVLLFCSLFLASICPAGEGAPNTPDIHGRMPLHHEVSMISLEKDRRGSFEKVKELVDKGASLEVLGPHSGQTPLMIAVSGDKCGIAEFLCQQGANLETVSRGGFHTAAWFAVTSGSVEALAVLLKHGADVNAVCDSSGRTLLTDAIDYAKPQSMECLVEHGANLNAQDKFGRTPVDRALDFFFTTDDCFAYDFLEKKGAKITEEHKERFETIKELLPKESS